MALVTLPNLGPDPITVNASVLNGKVDPLATDYNGNIQNVNIASGAGITYSKLTLTDGILNADINSSAAIAASKIDLGTIAQAINEAKGSDIASATTTDIGAATGNFVDVTGTTTITGLGTVQAGTRRIVRFTGALTLTHNATSLILPGAANITTIANDIAEFVSLGSGNWVCVSYQKGWSPAKFPVEGYSTGRNVLRKTRINISAGATPGTNVDIIEGTDTGVLWNNPTISAADDLAKNGSSGSFALNAGGTELTLDISETIISVLSTTVILSDVVNSSTTAGDIFWVTSEISSGNAIFTFHKAGVTADQDLLNIITSAGDSLFFDVIFITST